MDIGLVAQSLLAGITNGLTYALIGIGLAAIFKGSRVPNAMQGEFSVVGAIVVVLLLTGYGWPYWLAILCGCLAGAVLGAFIEIAFIRYMIRNAAPEDSYLLLTIGIGLFISAAVLYFFGRESHLLPGFGGDNVYIVLDAVVREHVIWLIAISVLLTIALRQFYRRTSVGLKMMAASIDPEGATSIGIDVALMRTFTFMLGGALGAAAGILITPIIPVDYMIGLQLTLKGFAAAILGGLTNPLGAAIGGLALGIIEAMAIVGGSSSYKDVITFGLLILIMIAMPQGLLGRAGRTGG
ncbi:branched-chain amino acid ABC transporter permease [Bradyrhizobium sp. KBS0727]|uniref:branched-chain amino acid ABC transporter permease n=1 Tax=unclassified Bradyrhizobium TaxID=2631580 RepID=UPI00110D9222|nr:MULTISPECIES: branched-chain amino acid ABC transporter permease [unclassified Bradyrhizobium]QDW37869.1 branched-chain amino acid ABC transporter permease [Bradyrhizobium sp. KBS0725]QDW44473.1 branched-chain amino acid ABC transporter permease [Bradyrhizobium sp. KBS0727]